MARFDRLTPETNIGASRDLLGELIERHDAVGDMVSPPWPNRRPCSAGTCS